MSNIVNIFGSTNGALGPCDVIHDPIVQTGDTGDALNLGGTQGVTLRDTIVKSPITADQKGSEPFNQVTTGETVELEATFVQTSFEILAAVLQGFNSYVSGAEGASKGQDIGTDDLSIAKPLELIRLISSAQSPDTDDQLIIPVAAPMGEIEWTYDASGQRVANVKYRCYPSDNYIDSVSGAPLYYFTRSALANGHVIFST